MELRAGDTRDELHRVDERAGLAHRLDHARLRERIEERDDDVIAPKLCDIGRIVLRHKRHPADGDDDLRLGEDLIAGREPRALGRVLGVAIA